MTRFDADSPADRRALFVDAVVAHRERASQFLTVEVDPDPALDRRADAEAAGDANRRPDASDDTDGDGASLRPPPWIQYAEGTINVDCTSGELETLQALVDEYPEFRIDQLESPEMAEGTNVRITAYADADRIAEFVDRAFCEVYGRPTDYRAWVVAV
jgi:hypothetical protein